MRSMTLLLALAALLAAAPVTMNPGSPGATPGPWRAADIRAPAPHAPAAAPGGGSAPLALHGDVGFNVRAALDANGGALRRVVIPPGATWSFNAAVGDPSGIPLRVVGGVRGGGWCDLASRYVQAARPLLPPHALRFTPHRQATGVGLADVADADAVAIWNIDGAPGSFGGRRDLEIVNVTDAPLVFAVEPADGDPARIVVRATVVRPGTAAP